MSNIYRFATASQSQRAATMAVWSALPPNALPAGEAVKYRTSRLFKHPVVASVHNSAPNRKKLQGRANHALALDERRRMFRVTDWTQPQPHVPNRLRPKTTVEQDIEQRWYPGVHSDIGGGYREDQSAL